MFMFTFSFAHDTNITLQEESLSLQQGELAKPNNLTSWE